MSANIKISDAITRLQGYSNNITGRVEDSDWQTYLNDYVRAMRRSYNFPWSERTTALYVFQDVFTYSIPSDFAAFVKPQIPLSPGVDDNSWFQAVTQPEFARNYESRNLVALTYEQSVKYLLVRYSPLSQSSTLLHDCDTFDGNGTWAGTGDANTVATDAVYYRQGGGSVSFTITKSSNTATLTNNNMAAIDLTNYLNVSYIFFYVYLQSVPTSISIRWGSDASDYYSASATTQFSGAAFLVGWNLIGVNWYTASTTGSPVITAINYLQINLVGCTSAAAYRIDGIYARKWTELTLPYYGLNNFQSNGAASPDKEFCTADDDTLLGDSEFIDNALAAALLSAAKWKLKDKDLIELAKDWFDTSSTDLRRKYPNLAPEGPQSSYFNLNLLD